MLLDFIHLDSALRAPLYAQLADALRDAVASGQIPAGTALPSVRQVAADLNVSKTTVETAYDRLISAGYLEAQPQRGYFSTGLSRKRCAENLKNSRTGIPARTQPLRYRFSTTEIDAHAFPIALWQRHLRQVLARTSDLTSYGNQAGEPALREALARYAFDVRGVTAPPERIVVGAGLQPLLYILSGLLRTQARMIGLEDPGFAQAERVFADCGLPVCRLPYDEAGVDPAALDGTGVRALYLTPCNRQGSGIAMPIHRRLALLDWARRSGGLMIEDDHNGELQYRGRPIPALQGFDDGTHTVYIGTFSKVLLPSVRLAYMVLTPALAEAYYARARAYHPTASKIEQLALAESIRSGEMEKQLRRLRRLYAEKGNRLTECLRAALGDRVRIELQETALRLLVTVSGGRTADELTARAAAMGVEVRPFPAYAGDGRVLLGFSGIALDDIPEAVRRLARAWTE